MPSQFAAIPTPANTGLDTMATITAAMQSHQQDSMAKQHLRQLEREQRVQINSFFAQQESLAKTGRQQVYKVKTQNKASVNGTSVNRVAKTASQTTQVSSPPTVDYVDTAEEFEKLPVGTFVRRGRYSGYKLDDVSVTRANGTIIRSRREYEQYILWKYPYTAAMILTDPGKYGPWNPEAIAVELSGSVDAIFFTMSGRVGIGVTNSQVGFYGSFGGEIGMPVFNGGMAGRSLLRRPGFGVGASVIFSDKTTDIAPDRDLNPFGGLSLGQNVNLGPLAFGRSQGLRQTSNGLSVDPRGYTNYGLGIGSGFSYRSELMRTYIKIIDIHSRPK